MIFLFVFGTLMITASAIGIIFSVVLYKRREIRIQLERQQMTFNYEQALYRSRIEVQETALNTISRELHDGVNAELSSCLAQMRLSAEYMTDEKGASILNKAKNNLANVSEHVRSLSHSLNTGIVEESSLAEDIGREVERIKLFSKIELVVDDTAKSEPGPQARLLLFRCIQEALSNTLKHAEADRVLILCLTTPLDYVVTIRDNGKGFDANAPLTTKSLGLRSMSERVTLVQGKLDIKSSADGTTITFQIPLKTS